MQVRQQNALMVWACKDVDEFSEIVAPSPEQWEAVLASVENQWENRGEPWENQRGLVTRAVPAAAGHGFPD